MNTNDHIKATLKNIFKKEIDFEEITFLYNSNSISIPYKKNTDITLYKQSGILFCRTNKLYMSFHESFYTEYIYNKKNIEIIKSYEYIGNKINEIQMYETTSYKVLRLKNNYNEKKIYFLLSKSKDNISIISEENKNKLSDFFILFDHNKTQHIYLFFEMLIKNDFKTIKKLIESKHSNALYDIIKLNKEELKKENLYFPFNSYNLILDYINLNEDFLIKQTKIPEFKFISTKLKSN